MFDDTQLLIKHQNFELSEHLPRIFEPEVT